MTIEKRSDDLGIVRCVVVDQWDDPLRVRFDVLRDTGPMMKYDAEPRRLNITVSNGRAEYELLDVDRASEIASFHLLFSELRSS